MNNNDIQNLRENYSLGFLLEEKVDSNPLKQFKAWLEDAIYENCLEPNAMTLSTINNDGGVSSRVVLLKEISENGFVFYTNYNSKKGNEMEINQHVALNFVWLKLERQVRVEGIVNKVDASISDDYFNSRPRNSQIGAWASPQSFETTRKFMEEEFSRIESEFEGKEVPRPENWGGYEVIPTLIEFWQGRRSRLHDRLEFKKNKESQQWDMRRLGA